MKIHHLNCATMRPVAQRFVFGDAPPALRKMVAHVLLIELSDRLLLVDSGFGTADCAERGKRLGRLFCAMVRPSFDPEETALRQVERLGYDPRDVRDVVCTHLDLDHAGGLADFPEARVHVLADEHAAAVDPAPSDRTRYRVAHWAHGPRWALHTADGEGWFGFRHVRPLGDAAPDVLLVPLLGHSRGHCGVAVRRADDWLLHCGDAYFHHNEMEGGPVPRGLSLFQKVVQVDAAARLGNQDRLRALAADPAAPVTLFSAHCPSELARLRDVPVSSPATAAAR